jgi:hypothetical protein
VLGYGLNDGGFEYREGLGIFLHTGSGAHPPSPLFNGYHGLFHWGSMVGLGTAVTEINHAQPFVLLPDFLELSPESEVTCNID